MKDVEEELQTDELIELAEYVKHFNIHYSLLLRRYKRFSEIDKILNTDIDIITYLDMIVVQLRAMCIENTRNKKNYTVQTLLRKVGENDLSNRIDNMLDQEFLPPGTGMSTRKALKFLADCFICHYDNFDGNDRDGWDIATMISNRLCNAYSTPNLDSIMKTLIDCIGEGLTIKS